MKKATVGLVVGGILFVIGAAGCQSKVLPLQKHFDEIKVGQSTATEVLNRLPEQGMMHTASAVSVYNRMGWAREAGIVKFSPTDSTVLRSDYVQTRSNNAGLFTHETILLRVQSVIPPEVLNAPYENEVRKYSAILQHFHEAMIEDARPFDEDQGTESLLGMGRTALGMGILEVKQHPREAERLLDEPGFAFKHPTLGKCHLYLRQDADDVFTLTVSGGSWVDPFMTW